MGVSIFAAAAAFEPFACPRLCAPGRVHLPPAGDRQQQLGEFLACAVVQEQSCAPCRIGCVCGKG